MRLPLLRSAALPSHVVDSGPPRLDWRFGSVRDRCKHFSSSDSRPRRLAPEASHVSFVVAGRRIGPGPNPVKGGFPARIEKFFSASIRIFPAEAQRLADRLRPVRSNPADSRTTSATVEYRRSVSTTIGQRLGVNLRQRRFARKLDRKASRSVIGVNCAIDACDLLPRASIRYQPCAGSSTALKPCKQNGGPAPSIESR